MSSAASHTAVALAGALLALLADYVIRTYLRPPGSTHSESRHSSDGDSPDQQPANAATHIDADRYKAAVALASKTDPGLQGGMAPGSQVGVRAIHKDTVDEALSALASPVRNAYGQVMPFSQWAALQLMGVSLACDEAEQLITSKGKFDSDTGELASAADVFEALRTVCALYLRADIDGIRDVIRVYRLEDILTRYLTDHVQTSSTLDGLGLQVSRAFVHDALRQTMAPGAEGASKHMDLGDAVRISMMAPQALNKASEPADTADATAILDVSAAQLRAPRIDTDYLASKPRPSLDLSSHRNNSASSQGDPKTPTASDSSESQSPGARQRNGSGAGSNGELAASARLGRRLERFSTNTTHKSDKSDGSSGRRSTRLFAGGELPGGSVQTLLKKFGARTMLTYLMSELEALLTKYLSYNWTSMEDVFDANSPDLHASGLVCAMPARGPSRSTSDAGSHGAIATAITSLPSGDSTSSFNNSGCHTGSTQSLPPAEARARRVRKNWQRAYQAYLKHAAVRRLKPKREFRTLQQMLQVLSKPRPSAGAQGPNGRSGRRPVFMFLGGGMAAGKSTVREIVGSNSFWHSVGDHAVVIEADALKNQDVVFQELAARQEFNNDSSISAFVHEWSTQKAQGMLAAAVNQQRDIIFDGTCSWLPFVKQTISMIRDHEHAYELGPGYQRRADGSVDERYWVRMAPGTVPSEWPDKPLPYRIELVGVTCHPTLAVARGLWRKLRTGRAVPIGSQLRSHRLFAENWSTYCSLVDNATLYHTGSDLTTLSKFHPEEPRVIAHKSEATRGELLVHPVAYSDFQRLVHINDDAASACQLYSSSATTDLGFLRCPANKEGRLTVLTAAFKHAYEKDLLKLHRDRNFKPGRDSEAARMAARLGSASLAEEQGSS